MLVAASKAAATVVTRDEIFIRDFLSVDARSHPALHSDYDKSTRATSGGSDLIFHVRVEGGLYSRNFLQADLSRDWCPIQKRGRKDSYSASTRVLGNEISTSVPELR